MKHLNDSVTEQDVHMARAYNVGQLRRNIQILRTFKAEGMLTPDEVRKLRHDIVNLKLIARILREEFHTLVGKGV